MKNDLRIGYNNYYNDEEFERTVDFLKENLYCIDEVCLFTEFSHHGYYSLETIRERAVVWTKRLIELKAIGIKSVGLNVLDTIGHINEGWDIFEKPPFQTMVGHDGQISLSCLCPNNDGYKRYITEKYKIIARTKTEFLWVDDDIRLHNHGVSFACFCDDCLRIFNKNNNYEFDRESLVEALNSHDGQVIREQWVSQNTNTIIDLLAVIEKAVHEVNPGIVTGLMTYDIPWGFYSNTRYDKWMSALKAQKGRPGGGFYNENQPNAFINKALEAGRQIAHYPDTVTDIQYELENFPYQKLSKSVKMIMLECAASLMNGTRGIAMNVLPMTYSNVGIRKDIFEGFRSNYSLWQKIDEIAGDYKNVGLCPQYNLNFPFLRKVIKNDWFNFSYSQSVYQANQLCEIGIPLTMNSDFACGSVLIESMSEGFTNDELLEMLTKGVIMDGRSLEILHEKGLGEYCGVKIKTTYSNGVYEKFTNHELNGFASGSTRDASINFWGDDARAYELEPIDSSFKVDAISELYNIIEERKGICSTIYENVLGGRVAVCGYIPWGFLYSDEKRYQMNRLCNWLTRDQIPVYIEKCLKVAPFVKRSSKTGETLIMLTNCFLDPTGEFDVRIRTDKDFNLYYLDNQGQKQTFSPEKTTKTESEIIVTLDSLNPWDCIFIYVGNM